MRLIITLFMLFFAQLLNLAHASPQTRVAAEQHKAANSPAKTDDGRKRKTDKAVKKNRTKTSTAPAVQSAHNADAAKTGRARSVKNGDAAGKVKKLARVTPPKKGYKKGYGHQRGVKLRTASVSKDTLPLRLSPAHKQRYQHAKQTAMNKLMKQMGKPYRWGGSSPNTGFDCSGLIYYAYKDVVKIKIPRTANELYHLRDAAPVNKSELETGDLVFFRINNRGTADHVGVYLGNGKFIQSPRTGEEIRISYLSNDYWQDHYIGARRVVTPQTIR